MRKIFTEEYIMFFSILKWLTLATFIGIFVGLGISIFLIVLDFSIKNISKINYFFFILPVSFLLSSILLKLSSSSESDYRFDNVISSIHKKSGKINTKLLPLRIVAVVITIATGGSAGRQGPAAQIGSSIASFFSDIFKLKNKERKRVVICGLSAGFASVLGAPIAGSIFGLEVLIAGVIYHQDLLPSFIAGIVGYKITVFFGINPPLFPIDSSSLSLSLYPYVILGGIVFGLCSLFFIEILNLGRKLSKKTSKFFTLKALIGGTSIVFLTLIFSEIYLGLGMTTIYGTLSGQKVPLESFFLKSIFTSITLNFGGNGGVITPILFLGTSAGASLAQILNQCVEVFAALGLVGLLAGCTNTPIAATVLAIEIFGTPIAPYAAITSAISFLMTGHRCVFPAQILGIRKSLTIISETGKEMENITVRSNFNFRKYILDIFNNIKKIFIKH